MGAVGQLEQSGASTSSASLSYLLTFGDVLNPIHIARLVLEDSTRPPSLRRVPPNLLVGQGALEYAFNHEVPILPPDAIISSTARARWLKWTQDLQANSKPKADNPEIAKLRNEGQSSSPLPNNDRYAPEGTPKAFVNSDTRLSSLNTRHSSTESTASLAKRKSTDEHEKTPTRQPPSRSSSGVGSPYLSPPHTNGNTHRTTGDDNEIHADTSSHSKPPSQAPMQGPLGDKIVDTVGAVAIDCYGNIAAGSSSGGIGMKHGGRTGPAALVGVGTHVYPINKDDRSKTTVAVVTSGTGEHLATTLAASTCASRIYFNKEVGPTGTLDDTVEEVALQSFVEQDFMRTSNAYTRLLLSRLMIRRTSLCHE